MKRFVSIAAVFLFFIILLGLIVYKVLSPATPSKKADVTANPFETTKVVSQPVYTDTPNRTTASCYSWYLTAYITTATLDQIASQSQSKECFTADFISNWNALKATTEGDPVLTVMDYGPTWPSNMKVTLIGQSIRTAEEQVSLGTGDQQLVVIAHLQQQPDYTWKIDSVTKP